VAVHAEAYPFWRKLEGGGRLFWVANVGVARGTYLLNVFGRQVGGETEYEGPVGVPSHMLLSRETRLEAAFGIHTIQGLGRATIVLQPYALLNGAQLVDDECHLCTNDATSVAHAWGFVVAASLGPMFEF
jgi:hypothetical protein